MAYHRIGFRRLGTVACLRTLYCPNTTVRFELELLDIQ
jgi:hypothetical protein